MILIPELEAVRWCVVLNSQKVRENGATKPELRDGELLISDAEALDLACSSSIGAPPANPVVRYTGMVKVTFGVPVEI